MESINLRARENPIEIQLEVELENLYRMVTPEFPLVGFHKFMQDYVNTITALKEGRPDAQSLRDSFLSNKSKLPIAFEPHCKLEDKTGKYNGLLPLLFWLVPDERDFPPEIYRDAAIYSKSLAGFDKGLFWQIIEGVEPSNLKYKIGFSKFNVPKIGYETNLKEWYNILRSPENRPTTGLLGGLRLPSLEEVPQRDRASYYHYGLEPSDIKPNYAFITFDFPEESKFENATFDTFGRVKNITVKLDNPHLNLKK